MRARRTARLLALALLLPADMPLVQYHLTMTFFLHDERLFTFHGTSQLVLVDAATRGRLATVDGSRTTSVKTNPVVTATSVASRVVCAWTS